MLHETGYCECPKKPGGILEVDDLSVMIHTVCGKKIGPMPKERKPVYCAHPYKAYPPSAHLLIVCGGCGLNWILVEAMEERVIGYVEGD